MASQPKLDLFVLREIISNNFKKAKILLQSYSDFSTQYVIKLLSLG